MVLIQKTQLFIFLLILISSCCANSSYLERRSQGVDRQQFDSTCGIASISSILKRNYSVNKTEAELLALIKIKPEYSFVDLAHVAKALGIETLGVKISLQQLKELHSPSILYLNRLGYGHFVIFKGINDAWVQIEDPAWGLLNYTHGQFDGYWLQADGLGRALIFLQDKPNQIDNERIYYKMLSLL